MWLERAAPCIQTLLDSPTCSNASGSEQLPHPVLLSKVTGDNSSLSFSIGREEKNSLITALSPVHLPSHCMRGPWCCKHIIPLLRTPCPSLSGSYSAWIKKALPFPAAFLNYSSCTQNSSAQPAPSEARETSPHPLQHAHQGARW